MQLTKTLKKKKVNYILQKGANFTKYSISINVESRCLNKAMNMLRKMSKSYF